VDLVPIDLWYSISNLALTLWSILTANSSFLQWTYNSLAFPGLTLQASDLQMTEIGDHSYRRSISVVLPALRNSLNCAAAAPDLISTMWDGNDLVANISKVFPPECSDLWSGIYCQRPPPPEAYSDCYGEHNQLPLTLPSSCPLLTFAFSYINAANKTKGMNVLLCRPTVEQVEVEISLLLPQLAIDQSKPPRVISATSTILFDQILK
jgi:hypothetical protein